MSQSRSNQGLTGGSGTPDGFGGIREAQIVIHSADFGDAGVEDLFSIWDDAGLQHVETLACHESGVILQVSVKVPLEPAGLEAVQCVDRWECVLDRDDEQVFVFEVTAPMFPCCLAQRMDGLVDSRPESVSAQQIRLSLIGSQEAIADAVCAYKETGLSPELLRLSRYDGPTRPLDALTDRQREILETAHEAGYFEVPRGTTSEEIAKELGLEASTVTEHIQRAERNLLVRHLTTD